MYFAHSCVSVTRLDSNEPIATETKMSITEHEGLISRIPWMKSYSLLPPQHPMRFLGLCTQVFFYYLLYGYLQVCFRPKTNRHTRNIFFSLSLVQELLFTLKGFNDTAWFLSCYQFFLYGIMAFAQLGWDGLNQRR